MAASRITQVRKAAEAMDPAHLECRDMMHPWQPHRAWRVGRGFERILRCPRCYSEKHQQLDAHGGLVRSYIVYPDGYLVKGLGHLRADARAELRLASVVRQVESFGPPPTVRAVS